MAQNGQEQASVLVLAQLQSLHACPKVEPWQHCNRCPADNCVKVPSYQFGSNQVQYLSSWAKPYCELFNNKPPALPPPKAFWSWSLLGGRGQKCASSSCTFTGEIESPSVFRMLEGPKLRASQCRSDYASKVWIWVLQLSGVEQACVFQRYRASQASYTISVRASSSASHLWNSRLNKCPRPTVQQRNSGHGDGGTLLHCQ